MQADLTRWEPGRTWDLVVTNYAHADIGHLALYQRLSTWVAPGGTLLIVGHRHRHIDDHRSHDHPEEATATLDEIENLLRGPQWRIGAAFENTRTIDSGDDSYTCATSSSAPDGAPDRRLRSRRCRPYPCAAASNTASRSGVNSTKSTSVITVPGSVSRTVSTAMRAASSTG